MIYLDKCVTIFYLVTSEWFRDSICIILDTQGVTTAVATSTPGLSRSKLEAVQEKTTDHAQANTSVEDYM